MNAITYFTLLLSSFSWFSSNEAPKTSNAPQRVVECKSHYDNALKTDVYTDVEKEPEYPGGAAPWGRFVNRNFRLDSVGNAADCKVKIKMVVNTEGEILKVAAMRGNEEVKEPTSLEKEAVRIYRKSGRWVPGECGGNKVTTEFVQSLDPCN